MTVGSVAAVPKKMAETAEPARKTDSVAPTTPHLDEPGGDRVAGQLCEGDDQREAEGPDEVIPLRDEDRGDPDERAVIREVDAEPHQPQARRAHPELRAPTVRREPVARDSARGCRAARHLEPRTERRHRRVGLERADDGSQPPRPAAPIEPPRGLGKTPSDDQRVEAGIAPSANAHRQPSSELGITKYPISAAAVQPTAQNASSSTTMRPRMRAGANSLTYVEATGSSAPNPRPTKKRRTSSVTSPPTSALAPVASP